MITDKIIMTVVSSMEKCFPEDTPGSHPARERFLMFRNERLSFQVCLYNATRELYRCHRTRIRAEGALAPYIRFRQVATVAVQYPTSYVGFDSEMLREKPCVCPDPIRPLPYEGLISLPPELTMTLWADVELPPDFAAGTYEMTLALEDMEEPTAVTVTVTVADALLPPQRLIHTEWFYTDCIAEAHRVRPFSAAHWKLLEKYVAVAVKNGINMLLTPVFTPELDTYIGGERLTTQLVKITVTGKDRYAFDFSDLDRWIDMCSRLGVKYYEIPHFFTQWGAAHAPKFVARVNGRTRRIFGWETDAMGEEYAAFLGQFIPAMLAVLKAHGVDKNCYFHVSDEPNIKHIDHYRRCRELLSRYLEGYNIIDALSDYEFYESGAISKPVPAIRKIQPFLDHDIPGLWAYYCGNRPVQTGRCIATYQYRTRILGIQLWKENIEGFLHWGFNFWHNCNSYDLLDPLGETGGDFFAPSGDAFLVYPGPDDTPLESLRLNALREAVDDMRALDLLAEKKGRARAEQILTEEAGGTITFWDYPRDNDFFDRLRARVAAEIAGE